MTKLLFWLVVIITALLITRFLTHKKQKTAVAAPRKNHTAPQGSEEMVRCAHCDIYLPRSEAIMSNKHTWCSAAHARLGVRK